LDPLGIATTNRPIVPAPGDYDIHIIFGRFSVQISAKITGNLD
jgi:hypothetical protein